MHQIKSTLTNQFYLKPAFYSQALAENPAALPVNVEALLVEQAGRLAVVPTNGMDLQRFAQMGLCELEPLPEPRPILEREWGGEDFDELFSNYEQVVWQVRFRDRELVVVHVQWVSSCGFQSRDWVIAENSDIADEFILEVNRKTHAPGEAILVFSDGHWRRSEALYQAIQDASFEDLVLADDLKEIIRNDFRQFLQSAERYEKLGIAWRRGALFVGPPGNGKTHCVRALVKELGIACLYVQSLSHHYFTPQQMWQLIFQRARGLRPCVLILEDLDSLVTDDNRSFFLNQLDGFEHNHGLLVLATTNHPDRIDSSIIDRPSRFDRKYHFPLPTLSERLDYLKNWQQHLAGETGWNEDEILPLAESTDGFSFAYLKELIISAVMTWMQDTDAGFQNVLEGQVSLLKKQMKTEA